MKLPDKRILYVKLLHTPDGLLWVKPMKGENLRQVKRRVDNSIHGIGIRPLEFHGYVTADNIGE